MTSTGEGPHPGASIDDGFFAEVRGEAQWITLRGGDASNPPLLILTGPGAAFSGMAPFFAPWETAFTLAQWDQPGAGATFARNGEAALTLDRLAADAAAVAEIVLQRLGVAKLVVLGVSGGSIPGLKLAKLRPDLVRAFVGTGQIVHWARQQALGYEYTLAAARAAGDAATIADLERVGPPPYPDIEAEMVFSQHANAMTAAEQAAFASLDAKTSAELAKPPPGARYASHGLPAPDPRERGLRSYLAVKDEIAAFDAWSLGLEFEVPLLFLQGDLDHYTPAVEVAAYATAITAPSARLVSVPGGGHAAVFMREAFLELLTAHALPLGRP